MDAVTFAPLVAALLLLLISFPVHEAAHATAAWRLGDGHARALGRVSLDPRRHIDPLGAGLLLLSALSGGGMIGWAKPTPVMAQSLRGGSLGWAIVAVAGPLSNLFLAVVAAVLYRLIGSPPATDPVGVLIVYFTYFNAALLFLNLLPIPPFDGRALLTGVLALVSPRLADTVEGLTSSRLAFPVVIVLLFFTPLGSLLGDLSFGLTQVLLGSG
ncbi:MAG: site-2 protease family protein [bacterium Ellin6529]|jgi:Zn-dependent protease|nr:site-2 protease family protein [bacterium Ellin6529]